MLTHHVEGDTLIIAIDISEAAFRKAELSKTGKTRLVASTHGVVPIMTANGIAHLSLNLMSKER